MSRPPIGPRVYVCLPADVLARVDAIARERDVSRGEVLREAVELYLSRRKVAVNREKRPCPAPRSDTSPRPSTT